MNSINAKDNFAKALAAHIKEFFDLHKEVELYDEVLFEVGHGGFDGEDQTTFVVTPSFGWTYLEMG